MYSTLLTLHYYKVALYNVAEAHRADESIYEYDYYVIIRHLLFNNNKFPSNKRVSLVEVVYELCCDEMILTKRVNDLDHPPQKAVESSWTLLIEPGRLEVNLTK